MAVSSYTSRSSDSLFSSGIRCLSIITLAAYESMDFVAGFPSSLFVHISGKAVLCSGGSGVELQANNLFLQRQGDGAVRIRAATESVSVRIDFAGSHNWSDFFLRSPLPIFTTGNPKRLENTIRHLIFDSNFRTPPRQRLFLSGEDILISLLDLKFKEVSPHDRRSQFEDLITTIRCNLGFSWTSEILASSCGLSRSHFDRLFRSIYGIPPKSYLRELRLKRAKELLELTSDSVQSIALRCGYSDPFVFSHIYKKTWGLSPRKWRERAVPELRYKAEGMMLCP